MIILQSLRRHEGLSCRAQTDIHYTAAPENAHGTQADRFTVSCFPVKVRGGSAGWTRAVAILENA